MATPGRGKSRGGRALERSPVSQLKRPPEEDDLEATALELANLLLAWPYINFIISNKKIPIMKESLNIEVTNKNTKSPNQKEIKTTDHKNIRNYFINDSSI